MHQETLAVAGPICRSADDLALMLDILSGPDPHLESNGWSLDLPQPTVTTVEEGVPSVVDSNCTFNEFYAEGKSPESVVMAMPGEGQEITAEWLSGVINAPVTSCKSKAAAEGQTGVTFLITEIVYGEGLAADHMAPTSLAVKMHALTPEGRGFAILAKFYEKELFFFESE
jgi:hypothetical protein